MRRVLFISAACFSLAGCASFSLDSFRSAPPPVQVQLESVPPGADARTSFGPSCKTPCSLPVSADAGGFSVTYTLAKFQPLTVPVNVTRNPGDFLTPGTTVIDPNPVVGQLQPGTPRRAVRKMVKKRKPAVAAAPAEADAPAAGSPFPTPTR